MCKIIKNSLSIKGEITATRETIWNSFILSFFFFEVLDLLLQSCWLGEMIFCGYCWTPEKPRLKSLESYQSWSVKMLFKLDLQFISLLFLIYYCTLEIESKTEVHARGVSSDFELALTGRKVRPPKVLQTMGFREHAPADNNSNQVRGSEMPFPAFFRQEIFTK